MDIVMLGHSTSGKTTFMAALYYRMTNGLYNYKMKYDKWANYWYKRHTLNNYYYTLEEAEKEEKELNQISLNVTKGIYPPPTAIKQEYVFTMQYADYKEIRFNWFDYRGGALMERSNQNDDSMALMSKIKNSDALVVFLDGKKLEEPISKNEREFRRLIYLIKRAISNISVEDGSYFPISFVITKDDLCNDVLNSEGYAYFWENILNDIVQSNKIAGLITCTTINSQNIYNVHWPLLFSLNYNIYKFANEVFAAYQQRDNNRGLWGRIEEWWTDNDKNTTLKIINELQESVNVINEVLNEQNRNSLLLI